jgi:hypothetical protein
VSLNEDDTYPKEFLEYLHQLCDDVMSGKEELTTFKDIDELMENLNEEY